MAANVERKEVDKAKLGGVKVVWVIGGPGSGKGTQCENIQIKYDYVHLSTGDLLRAEVMSGSKRGSQLYKLMSEGQKVPDQIVDDLLAEAMLAKVEKSKGFLIDGFPMDSHQAAAFTADICDPVAVLYFEASDEVLKERLVKRNNFDDTDDAINNRIQTFNKVTRPLLDSYKDKVRTINAERPKEDIFEDVKKEMEKL